MTARSNAAAQRTARPETHRLLRLRPLTDNVFELTVTRAGMAIRPGQHVTLGIAHAGINREYSVYTITAETLAFLIKVRPGSVVSEALLSSPVGTPLALSGPFGAFTIDAPDNPDRRYGFIASGVGIAPFHAFVRAYPNLDYILLHGVHRLADRYDCRHYDPDRYLACVSREGGGSFQGRVTDYLDRHPVDKARRYYICGNHVMVSDTYDRLRRQGVPSDNLYTEVFF